jgi:hypothetical protein
MSDCTNCYSEDCIFEKNITNVCMSYMLKIINGKQFYVIRTCLILIPGSRPLIPGSRKVQKLPESRDPGIATP